MANLANIRHDLHEADTALLQRLRALRREARSHPAERQIPPLTMGQRIADTVAAAMGSWTFIIA